MDIEPKTSVEEWGYRTTGQTDGSRFYGSQGLCQSGHMVMWTGDPNYKVPEGYPCQCSQTIVHWETCPACGVSRMVMVPR